MMNAEVSLWPAMVASLASQDDDDLGTQNSRI